MKHISNIGILHYQIGNTDGVSLEISKWQRVLENLGYHVHLCAGDLGADEGFEIPELYHHLAEIKQIDWNAFNQLSDYDPGALLFAIESVSHRIEEGLVRFIAAKQIDLLIVNNIWSVGLNLPAAKALEKVSKKLSIATIGHHHDFYWERKGGILPTCQPVERILEKYFPPKDPDIQHVVINSLAQTALDHHKGLQARVVPNVFDFDAPPWSLDAYNQDLRARIGLKDKDIMVLQATRVIPRKGIELAIDFVKALNRPERRTHLSQLGLYHGKKFNKDSRIVLVMTGTTKDDVSGNYLRLLMDKARQDDVEVLHIEDMIAHSRGIRNSEKIYSFWDAYVVADLITYPSLWEGWGNQLLEAFQARLPVVLFEYPVYLTDIKDKGFDVITLGSDIDGYDPASLAKIPPAVFDRAAEEALVMLTDTQRRTKMVSHNHAICQEHYSLHALEAMLVGLLKIL